jgi:hypothetical protein
MPHSIFEEDSPIKVGYREFELLCEEQGDLLLISSGISKDGRSVEQMGLGAVFYHGTPKIVIHSKLKPSVQWVVFCHELVHAIDTTFIWPDAEPISEELVTALGVHIAGFLRWAYPKLDGWIKALRSGVNQAIPIDELRVGYASIDFSSSDSFDEVLRLEQIRYVAGLDEWKVVYQSSLPSCDVLKLMLSCVTEVVARMCGFSEELKEARYLGTGLATVLVQNPHIDGIVQRLITLNEGDRK